MIATLKHSVVKDTCLSGVCACDCRGRSTSDSHSEAFVSQRQHVCPVCVQATVGAGLPVIATLKHLVVQGNMSVPCVCRQLWEQVYQL